MKVKGHDRTNKGKTIPRLTEEDMTPLPVRSKIIDLLITYSEFLQRNNYLDTDWNTFAITDEFMREFLKQPDKTTLPLFDENQIMIGI